MRIDLIVCRERFVNKHRPVIFFLYVAYQREVCLKSLANCPDSNLLALGFDFCGTKPSDMQCKNISTKILNIRP